MFITKKSAGSVDGYKFAPGKPVDVPEELAGELLAIAPAEFELADKPKGRKAAETPEPEVPAEPEAAAPAMPQD